MKCAQCGEDRGDLTSYFWHPPEEVMDAICEHRPDIWQSVWIDFWDEPVLCFCVGCRPLFMNWLETVIGQEKGNT